MERENKKQKRASKQSGNSPAKRSHFWDRLYEAARLKTNCDAEVMLACCELAKEHKKKSKEIQNQIRKLVQEMEDLDRQFQEEEKRITVQMEEKYDASLIQRPFFEYMERIERGQEIFFPQVDEHSNFAYCIYDAMESESLKTCVYFGLKEEGDKREFSEWLKENFEVVEVEARATMRGRIKGDETEFKIKGDPEICVPTYEKAVPCDSLDWIDEFEDLVPREEDIYWPEIDSTMARAYVYTYAYLVRRKNEV